MVVSFLSWPSESLAECRVQYQTISYKLAFILLLSAFVLGLMKEHVIRHLFQGSEFLASFQVRDALAMAWEWPPIDHV